MSNTVKKLLALLAAATLVASLAACGEKKPTEEPVEDTTPAVVEDVSEAETEETSEEATEEETEEATEEETEEETKEEKGLNSTDKKEVVEFYKKAAEKSNDGFTAQQTMSLTSLDGGSGAVGGLVSAIEPIGRRALEKNSNTIDHVPGGWKKLTADDLQSASAKTSADGKYTEVTLVPKTQSDGPIADSEDGPVGHAVGVLPGIQAAIDEMNGVSVDSSQGTLRLDYTNPSVKVKINNDTGKIESGTWSHVVNVTIDNVTAKVAIIKATLHGAKVVVNYTITK